MAEHGSDSLDTGRFADHNRARNRRRLIDGGDLLRDGSIRARAFNRDVFPPDVDGTVADARPPSWHEQSYKTSHEDGVSTKAARADRNFDFTHPQDGETRVTGEADADYEVPFENILEIQNPTAPEGAWSMRLVSWTIKPEWEERITQGPIEVWARYDPAGGTNWGEPQRIGMAAPNEQQIEYVADPAFNFNPDAGTVATVDVELIPIHHDRRNVLKIPRAGFDGKIAEGFLPAVGVTAPVPNSDLADMPDATIKGRALGAGIGPPQDLVPTEVTEIIEEMVGDLGTGGIKGLVPAPATGDAGKYLKGDGTWASISGSVGSDTGWTAPTGTGSKAGFDTATATLTEVAQTLKALIDALMAGNLPAT